MQLRIEEYVKKQVIIAVCLNIGHIVTGYSTGWSSPVLVKLLDKDQSPLTYAITPSEASWVASLYMAGIVLGPIAFGTLANIIGRKTCIILSSVSALLGYVLVGVALDAAWIYCGQIIKGIGVSGIVLMDCMYIGEISSPYIRGIISASTSISHAFGILLVYSVGPFVSYRVISYVIIVVGIAHVTSCGYFLLESPVFQVLKGKEEAAKKTLEKLGRSKDIDTEFKVMTEKQKDDTNAIFFQLFMIRSNRMSLIINVVLLVVNQAGGVLCVLFYASIIFKNAASYISPEIATIILGATQFAGSLVTPCFIDKYGRKTLLLLSTALCAVILAILGIYFYLEEVNHASLPSIRWLPLLALVSFLFSFSFGINSIPSTLLGETFQPSVRGVGSAIAVAIGCIAGFASTASFNYIVSAIGSHFTFGMYAVINFIGFLFTLFVIPETKGKTLMEIEEMLR